MTTPAGSEAGWARQQQRYGTRDIPVNPRWLLRGDVGFDSAYGDEVLLAVCAEIEGLFVDLPPRPRERFTLVGCVPDGALADLLDRVPAGALGAGRAWLGDVAIAEPLPSPGRSPSWMGEDLGDVVVLARRPSRTVPEAVDIDLDGFVHVYDRTAAVVRPGNVPEFALLGGDGTPYGTCRDVSGVFREQAPPLVPRVRLLGCRPQAPLLAALDAVGRATKASLRRRRIRAEVHTIAADGSAHRVIDAVVSGTVGSGEPSRFGGGLLDVTVDSDPQEPLPVGVLDILAHRQHGPPVQKNMWSDHGRELRHQWAMVAAAHQSVVQDRSAGTTYDLDGRHVTDIEGFYCALGEAINGPGGYFGCNLDAFVDCLRGRFGASTPFRLVWHDSNVARDHLVAGYDRRRLAPAVTVECLLGIFAEHDVEVDLR
ncbi:barstar family protein [Micromonospora robiginosa]|uniref:Barstar family protein n=1 Tax=Micromonospora robiginosa TaxID=2749844 RepID=A0A7L6BF35_9ACTN|nr:barstar family protein [Micromonospora ferruginea]QLQ40529.2 barstar family protein [Micromonospora ferruginea]